VTLNSPTGAAADRHQIQGEELNKRGVFMNEDKENITWQPISFLPQIAEMIDGMLDASRETFEPLCQIKVHDDYTIKRIFEVTGQQVEDEWMYDEQLKIWLGTSELETSERGEIHRLQEQMGELKKVNRKILAIAEEHKDKTIEKVLGKSDAELGMDFLMGKLKL
jgi:hypothetical protein